MRLRPLFRRGDPSVRTSCDGGEFALQAIAAGLGTRESPERIHQARRADVAARLTAQEHLSQPDAERWIGRWEDEAAARGLEHGEAFWGPALDWIAEQRPSSGQP